MIEIIYIVIITYFILGAVGFYFINRKRDAATAKNNRVKFISYFIIINTLFFSIVVDSQLFLYISLVIIGFGLLELFKLFFESKGKHKVVFVTSLVLYATVSYGFYIFSTADKFLILYTFLILSIFDSFSQITGQLWGKTKIVPKISPNKTYGGFIGGVLISFISAFLLRGLVDLSVGYQILITLGILLFAFVGDIAASYYKRIYRVKDYSNLIPGHGGFLDRFDSLVVAGAWMGLCIYIFNI